jgi:hypothetical protein
MDSIEGIMCTLPVGFMHVQQPLQGSSLSVFESQEFVASAAEERAPAFEYILAHLLAHSCCPYTDDGILGQIHQLVPLAVLPLPINALVYTLDGVLVGASDFG